MTKYANTVTKRLIAITIIIAIMVGLTGCAVPSSADVVETMKYPEYAGDKSSATLKVGDLTWTPLSQQGTYSNMRLEWEDVLRILPYGEGDKNGVLYIDEAGQQEGNNTLRNGFRNRVFIEKYWSDSLVLSSLAESVRKVYADASTNEMEAILQGINGYYSILPDYEPNYANIDETLSRGQFLAGVYRAENPVEDGFKASADGVADFGDTEYTAYIEAMENAGYSYLDTSDQSLNDQSVAGKISRAEAIYTIVQMHFKQEYNAVDALKDKAYSDCANGGDIARKQGFIEQDKKAGTEDVKTYWKAYELEYALENADRGLPESLYKAMVVAKQIGLIEEGDSRWDEAITKGELIQLLINTYEAENERDGYLINAEYGEGEAVTVQPGGDILDQANNGGNKELSLLDIFRPSTHTDENGNWITTSDQYGILQTFDITAETHYIDWLPEQIMAEIMMNGEENVNDDMVAEIIKYVGELNLKGAYTDEELEEETLRLLDFFAETEGGYIDESGLWVSAEEHWKRTGRTPGGQGNEDTGIEILEASGTKYAKDSVNVRSEANKDSDKLGSLNWADEVEITGITSDGKWTRIEFNGGEGFVSSSYLLDEKPEKQKPSGGNNGGGNGGGQQENNGGSEAEQPDNGGGDSGNSGADDWEGLSGDWGGHGNGEVDEDTLNNMIEQDEAVGGLGSN